MGEYYIKTNRIFTRFRSYIWILTPLVAIGGLFEKKLGLLIPPIMLTLIVMSFFRGRYWCGNFCSHGSFYDKYFIKLSRNKKVYNFLNSKIVIGLFFTWFMFNITKKLIYAINSFGTVYFLDNLGFVFTSAYLMVLILGGAMSIVNSPRSWCRVCPMGVMQKASYKIGNITKVTEVTDKVLTIKNKEECHLCGKCSRVCPMQLEPYLNFDSSNRFVSNKCIKCNTCVKNCPASILSFKNNKQHLCSISKDFVGEDRRSSINGVVENRIMLRDDLIELVLSFNDNIEKITGGFVLLKIQDNPIQFRAYTVAKYIDNNKLSLIIKKEEKGYGTNIIFNGFNNGDSVTIKGPLKGEISNFNTSKKTLFIAGGVGITPFIQIMNEGIKEGEEINLLHAVRYEDELIYREYFEDTSKNNKSFNYIPILSRGNGKTYKKASIVEYLNSIKDIEEYNVYVCSSNRLAKSIEETLTKNGLNKSQIFIESL